MIKAVIFDLWGTLLYSNFTPRYTRQLHKVINFDISYNSFMKRFGEAFMVQHFNNEIEAVESICNKFEIGFSKELMKQIISIMDNNNAFVKPYPNLEALEELGKIYKLALLSNTEIFSLDTIRKHLNLDIFDTLALSFNTKLLKPSPLAFRNILMKLNLKPYEAVMVGNNLSEDIAPAKKLGINTIWINRKSRLRIENTIFSLKQLREKIANS